jgi:hypothetical protein
LTALIPKSRATPTFYESVSLYLKALEEHKDGPAPTADALVQAAVKRLPGRQLSAQEAEAVVERHVAEAALPIALNALRQLQGQVPQPARRTAGLWLRPKAQEAADRAKAAHDDAVAQLEAAVAQLQSGTVPPMFRHMMPATMPVIHEGRDGHVADYRVVDDEGEATTP